MKSDFALFYEAEVHVSSIWVSTTEQHRKSIGLQLNVDLWCICPTIHKGIIKSIYSPNPNNNKSVYEYNLEYDNEASENVDIDSNN